MAKNRNFRGFTLIELLVFVIVLGIAISTILTATVFGIKGIPIQHNQTMSSATSSKCMEYLVGQRYLNGFNFNNQNCPGGAIDTNVPAFCANNTPAGFSTSVSIKCTTVSGIGGIQKFKEIEVETTGEGASILKQIIADY